MDGWRILAKWAGKYRARAEHCQEKGNTRTANEMLDKATEQRNLAWQLWEKQRHWRDSEAIDYPDRMEEI